MNWKNAFRLSRNVLRPFPASFMFGVATADHQCEAYDPDGEDIRDVWERQRGLTGRGRGTDFTNRYTEDIELARQLGCTAFRFSIAWSRVEPAPGVFSEATFDYYCQLIAAIRAAGMEPILTLHHFTWPVHLEQGGGMIADDFPAKFAGYTAEVVKRVGQEVRFWITFNEPSQLIYGYIKPWWERNYFTPPGLPEEASLGDQTAALAKLLRNLFVAHTEARRVIRQANPQAQVGANPLLLGLPVWLQRLINWNAGKVRSFDDLARQGQRLTEPALLERGEVDMVVATLTQTAERARQVMFSETYFVAGQRLLVNQGTPPGDRELAGQTVVVIQGSTAEAAAPRLLPGARVRAVSDYAAALRLLDRTEAAAILADDTILYGYTSRYPGKYQLVGPQLTSEPYAVGVSQGNSQLLDVIDRVVRQFKGSGAWAASYARHLGQPVPEPPPGVVRALAFDAEPGQAAGEGLSPGPLPLAKPGTGLRAIQDRGYLVAAVKADVPGFGYQEPGTAEFSGLEIDLARAIAECIFGDAKAIRFRPVTTRERIPRLRSLLRFLEPVLKQYSILSTILVSNWWHLGMAGKLAEFLCPQECVGQQDFVGLDYYWGISTLRLNRLQRLIDAGMGRFDRAPVWPGALYGLLRYQASLFPNLPLLVIENGSVDAADGIDRVTYLRDHVRQVQRAVHDGANVAGYTCWSITSNREWGYAFSPGTDFGLYHIDLDNDEELKRVPTPAVAAYQDIIARRGV